MATQLNHVAIDQSSIKYTKLYNLFEYLFLRLIIRKKVGLNQMYKRFDCLWLRLSVNFSV